MSLIGTVAEDALGAVCPPAGVALEGLSVGGRVIGALRTAGGWLSADWCRPVALGALLAFGVQTGRIDGLSLRLPFWPHWHIVNITGLKGELAEAQGIIAKIRAAQDEATTAQIAVNHEPARISRALAEKSDADAAKYYEASRLAGAAYAAADRLRGPDAAGGTGNADLPGTDHPAAQHDGPGEAVAMVAIPAAAFDLCTSNTARLAQMHQDALGLISKGLAVAEDAAPASAKVTP